MSLSSIQGLMKESLLHDSDDNELAVQLNDKRRLFVYQNTIFGQLIDVLSSTYSVVKALVGEEYFNLIATSYIRDHPPTKSSLTYYGESFVGHIKNQEALLAMPYIIDMAAFEWAWNYCFFANNANYLNPEELLSLDEKTFQGLSFTMHPSCRLLPCKHSIYELWQWIEQGAEGEPPVIKNADVTYLFWRTNNHEIAIETASHEDTIIWKAIIDGEPLSRAFKDLSPSKQGEWLEKILTSSMVSGYSIESEN